MLKNPASFITLNFTRISSKVYYMFFMKKDYWGVCHTWLCSVRGGNLVASKTGWEADSLYLVIFTWDNDWASVLQRVKQRFFSAGAATSSLSEVSSTSIRRFEAPAKSELDSAALFYERRCRNWYSFLGWREAVSLVSKFRDLDLEVYESSSFLNSVVSGSGIQDKRSLGRQYLHRSWSSHQWRWL